MSRCMGSKDVPNDAMLSRAYCEGRTARYAGALATANPHPAGTPNYAAWARGWATYEAAGTVTWQDCCDRPGKLATRSLDMTVDPTDTTGATWDSNLTPDTPCDIDWGDGSREHSTNGTASHVYAADGDYTVICWLGSLKLAEATITVTIVGP